MGGNFSKQEKLDYTPKIDYSKKQIAKSKLNVDWPSAELRSRISQQQTPQPENKANGNQNTMFSTRTFNSIEENKSSKPIREFSYQHRKGTLSKRQNIISEMTQRVMKKEMVLCKIPLQPGPTFSFQGQENPDPRIEFSSGKETALSNKNLEYPNLRDFQIQRSPKPSIHNGNYQDNEKTKLRKDFQSKINKFLYSKHPEEAAQKPSTAQKSNNQSNLRSSIAKFGKKQKERNSSKNTNSSVVSKKQTIDSITTDSHIRKVLQNRHKKQPNSPLSLKKSPQHFSQQILKDGLYRMQTGRLSTRIPQKSNLGKGNSLRQSQPLGRNLNNQLAKKESSNDRLDTRDSTHDKIDFQRKRFNKNFIQKAIAPQQSEIQELQKRLFSPPQNEKIPSYNNNDYQQQPIPNPYENENMSGNNLFNKQIQEQFKEISLPIEVVILILMYNANELPKLLRLSASWHLVINEALEQYTFLQDLTSMPPVFLFCSEKGIKLDRVFQCEIINNPELANKTVNLGYTFGYEKSNKETKRYHCEHRFDVIKPKTPRVTWIHQSYNLPPYSQNEIQMAPGDTIELCVNILNLNGFVDLDTFSWDPLQRSEIPKNDRDPLKYDRDLKILFNKNDRKIKVHCNTNRICEVEDAVPEWIVLGREYRDQPKLEIDFKKYLPYFDILNIQFNELDQHYNKVILQCRKKGIV